MSADADTSTAVQLVTFVLEGKRLAVDASLVVEIIPAVLVAPVPKGPPILEGVIDYRGDIVPVLDTRLRLGLPPRPVRVTDHMIVARVGRLVSALRVDRALDLDTVPRSAIEDARAVVPQAELAAGVVRLPDGLVVIQDLDAFLDLEGSRAVVDSIADFEMPPAGPNGGAEMHDA